MSRKSRYTPDVPNIADMAKLYTNKTGIYARISHADGDNASESIANQLKICDSFIRRSDDLVRVRTYVDDGRSGYNINRPGFQKMLEDIHDAVLTEIVKRASLIVRLKMYRFLISDKSIRPMAINSAFSEFTFRSETCENTVRSSRRNITKCPDIGVHNIRMGFQEFFNLQPAQGFLIHLSIAHRIARFDCVDERCFDN